MGNQIEIVRQVKAGRLKIEEFDWGLLAGKILRYLEERDSTIL